MLSFNLRLGNALLRLLDFLHALSSVVSPAVCLTMKPKASKCQILRSDSPSSFFPQILLPCSDLWRFPWRLTEVNDHATSNQRCTEGVYNILWVNILIHTYMLFTVGPNTKQQQCLSSLHLAVVVNAPHVHPGSSILYRLQFSASGC